MPSSASTLLIAMSTEARGQSLFAVAENLNLRGIIVMSAEHLLLEVRKQIPRAIIIEEHVINSVREHDLVALLRRRDTLASIPIICLGTGNAQAQMQRIETGIDLYLTLPTRPGLLQSYLQRFLDKQSSMQVLQQELGKLRHLDAEYRKAERVKEDLTHMLVHDLKSPIASVMGLLDHSINMLAEDEQRLDRSHGQLKDVFELLALAKSESHHLLSLAANILDVRRMREGHMPYEPAWIDDLGKIVKSALHDATSSPNERNFDFIITAEARRIYADPNLLRRVITNLFSNAVKHTRQEGYIDFRAWKEGNAFMLSVRDNGEGIPEADQRRIFNAFEQSRHTVHDRYDTGMGLTFCKMAIEKHGGKIWVESKVGTGSTFYIRLPVPSMGDLAELTNVSLIPS